VTPLIRTATPADIPALEDIEQASFGSPHWDADGFLKYPCVVAEVECRIAGFLVSRQVFPGYQDVKPEREILNVAVAPVYRRLGVATALLRHSLSSGATHYLEVRESNVAARNLYHRLGFEEIARRPNYYAFPSETAIVMEMK
jgi:[ribosomal protein S18]-alanine N-acetyltransferase